MRRLVGVVVTWNRRDDTSACLDSLRGLDVVCVDNGSTDGTPEAVERGHPEVELVRNTANLGFAAGSNIGMRRALERGADWVLLINNDAVAEPGLPHALAQAATHRPDAGVLACKVLFADSPGRVEYGGAAFHPLLGYSGRQRGYGKREAGHFDALRQVDYASGAGMAISRAAIQRAGMLDETLYMYVEDVEWCLRIRAAGFAVVFVPQARVLHRGSASSGGRGSPAALYYHARNTLAVSERYRPLPRGLRSIRRGVVLATHLLQARRGEGAHAVLAGWRDYRAGKMGARA
jgi:GT2 family glycosyltransferase